MKRHVIGVAAAVLGTMLMGGVVATQTAAAADPVPTTVTLPLFGAPLTIGITTGPGGALSAVTVDPATGNTATSASPHKVVFESANPAGDPARVVIKSKHGGQSVSARAGSLADFTGIPGGWSGDLFGTGVASTVAFSIEAAADGSPNITGVTASAGGVVGPVQLSSGEGDDDEGNEMSARVSITFTNSTGDQSRTVTIKVKVGTDEDGTTSAKLSISLGRIKGVEGKAVGPHTWTGLLCDNTSASIAYTVAADGTITVGTITPAGATTSSNDGKTSVTFATGEQVRIKVGDHDGGQMTVSVKEKIRCDSADPTFNGSSVPTTAGDHNDNHQGGGGDNHGHGDHAGDDDTATSSTLAKP
ncbi:MAG: hypothetical protein ABI706_09840 [Ilumatobacteraceae bacterium]